MSASIPKYLRQKEKNRADRAIVIIDGKRHKLGVYGSAKSKAKYAELIAKPSTESVPILPTMPPTVSEVMAAYLPYVDQYYGIKSAMWYHFRSR